MQTETEFTVAISKNVHWNVIGFEIRTTACYLSPRQRKLKIHRDVGVLQAAYPYAIIQLSIVNSLPTHTLHASNSN